MPRITLIGAGSTVFAKRLIGDILLTPELRGEVEVMLHDIDTDRLKTSEIVTRRLAKSLNLDISIQASTDRRAMLREADYVILMMQVGGFRPATVTDFEIPKKYGLRQTIADTLGIGGIMRGLRTIPVLEEILQEMEDLCPDATLLNYVNPMVMLCMAINRIAPERKMVGLCHSVQGTAEELAKDLGEELKEINYFCAGINHMSFYLRFEKVQKGEREDLYPRLMEIAQSERMPKENRVRYEMLKRLGYFVTESSEHFAEYTPWFIKRDRPDLIEGFNIPLDEYITRCENQISEWDQLRRDLEDESVKLDVCQSHEYAASIINAMETGVSSIINGNVPNQDIISNLPSDISVEVPCQIDRNGIQPLHVGNLPPQLAALIMTNVNVQQLTVEAAMTGKREYIYHAAMMDPHTAAELSIDEIWKLVDELIEAHGAMLPKFH
ncbi:MAG TPA: alpha-glucosidase/alpha-galactosidase [SAR324 cluster bacterium]|nr:alpha-glucosidase/alpha-galactosidase [SAR324 cluster bacterium]MEE1577238.1 alpha-glucosidase/alpha-galactosidase [Deltaproteobacteria bacterium]MDP6464030.1 alpha-glucosidase/alpha-galactosidase [SAR324 cluster bacterium]MDP6638819.1 alpha-glucosidase/alpha-galactosidase [SAR324 cluster bacterium]MDP6728766.1 alpha-glucosidase/alpha-galactosidase [SAR324 cluster bacterium]